MNEPFLYSSIGDFFTNMGVSSNAVPYLRLIILVVIALMLAKLVHLIFSKIILHYIQKAIKKTKTNYDDYFIQHKFFRRVLQLIPALVLYFCLDWVFSPFPGLHAFFSKVIWCYFIIVTLLMIQSTLRAFGDIYNSLPNGKERPIQSYLQSVMLVIVVIGILIMVSILFNVKITTVLTGIGATAAVLMLVFKDTILGFVASIQLSANNMVKPGDWISMPSHNADGTVLAMTLNTIKVQNWDKTITTIPTYSLVSESFSNWKGMEESGGRRIKRSINIDMKSVRFCDEKLIEKLSKISILKDFINKRLNDIEEHNSAKNIDDSILVNGRRMTNLGVFRAYLECYLHENPKINDSMTFLVRQLQPTDKGIPLEIYVFSKDQVWANYESIQADIFDHILATIPEFDLKVFQIPTEYTISGVS